MSPPPLSRSTLTHSRDSFHGCRLGPGVTIVISLMRSVTISAAARSTHGSATSNPSSTRMWSHSEMPSQPAPSPRLAKSANSRGSAHRPKFGTSTRSARATFKSQQPMYLGTRSGRKSTCRADRTFRAVREVANQRRATDIEPYRHFGSPERYRRAWSGWRSETSVGGLTRRFKPCSQGRRPSQTGARRLCALLVGWPTGASASGPSHKATLRV